MPKREMLTVVANPFSAELDHEGRPHGRLQYEPNPNVKTASLDFVGCRLVATLVEAGKNGKPGVYDTHVEYSRTPVQVQRTAYYMKHGLKAHGHHGPALLPADLATFIAVHGQANASRYRDPLARLAQLAAEREAVPVLQLDPAAAAARAEAVAAGKATPRDHAAEWAAHVAAAVKAEAPPAKPDVAATPPAPEPTPASSPKEKTR
jgi:hypothetical protein